MSSGPFVLMNIPEDISFFSEKQTIYFTKKALNHQKTDKFCGNHK